MAPSTWTAVLMAPFPWIVVTLLAVLFIYGFHPIARWKFRRIPGPPPSWLLGNLPELVRKGQHAAYLDWERRYGPIYKIFLGGNMVLVVGDATAARKVARSSAWRAGLRFLDVGEEQKFNEYGIIASRGDAWRATSNAWHPFFARGSLDKFLPLMVKSADRLAELLGECADSGREVDIWRQFGNMAMDVVGSTAFGVDLRTLEGSNSSSSEAPSCAAAAPSKGPTSKTPPAAASLAATLPSSGDSNSWPQLAPETPTHMKEGPVTGRAESGAGAEGKGGSAASRHSVATPAGQLVQAVRDIFDGFDPKNPWFALHMVIPELDLLVRWAANIFPTAKFKKTKQGRRTLRSVARQLLTDFKANTAAGGGTAPELAASGGKGVDPGSFFALQARAIDRTSGEPFPEDWVIQQAFIFIGGGYETTANALAACAYCLAAHPDKESKLLAELDAFGGDKEPSQEDLQALPYAEAVWKESLRLYPPGTALGRELQHDLAIEGHLLPKGTQVQANVYAMHRNPLYWRDPEAFLPERFLSGEQEAQGSHTLAWMPFGDGARRCIGSGFATQEGVVALVRLYQKLVFRLTPGQIPLKVRTTFTHGPAEGVRVTVHRRGA